MLSRKTAFSSHDSKTEMSYVFENPPSTVRTMQSDEDFNIKFVSLVKMHNCLYDKKVPEYRNREKQEKAWTLISAEARESVIHCKERWRNLRACLSRYIKQQSGNDPQQKPYYLTEHMAFLLPFLKPNRQSLDSSTSSSSGAFQPHPQDHKQTSQHRQLDLYKFAQQQTVGILEMKHSLSDNDEETIDAFDAATSAEQAMTSCPMNARTPLSDTNSMNTFSNFIPDVQLEIRTPPYGSTDNMYAPLQRPQQNNNNAMEPENQYHQNQHRQGPSEPKRIKTEVPKEDANLSIMTVDALNSVRHSTGPSENADMEFFRSILPDLAGLTPQQKRKFKIGLLELIDDVVVKFPNEHHQQQQQATTTNTHRSEAPAETTVADEHRSFGNHHHNNNHDNDNVIREARGEWRK